MATTEFRVGGNASMWADQAFHDKTVLIGRGDHPVGAAIARMFAQAGARLIIQRDTEPTNASDDALKLENLGAKSVAWVRQHDDELQLFGALNESIGSQALDILVTGHSTVEKNELLSENEFAWSSVYQKGFVRALQLVRFAALRMAQQRFGCMTVLSNVFGEVGNGDAVAHSATMAGLLGLTKASARELAARNVRVNAVSYGVLDIEKQLWFYDASTELEHIRQTPLRRLANCEDIAGAVAYLTSPLSSYLTGEIIRVNGGWHM